MKLSGVAPSVLGACFVTTVVATATARSLCFMAGSRGFLPPTRRCRSPSYTPLALAARRLSSSSSNMAATKEASDGHPSEHAATASSLPTNVNGNRELPSSSVSTRRQRRKVCRRTRLNSTKERVGSTTHLPKTITGQEYPAEVDPIAPQYGPGLDPDAGQQRHDPLTLKTSSLDGDRGIASVATSAALSTAERPSALERQQLLDMTHPPAELLKSTEFGDNIPAVEASALGIESGSGVGTDGVGGFGIWASRGFLAAAAMIYGTNFGCVKLLEEGLPMSLAAALRFSVSVVPFIPALLKINPAVLLAGAEIGLYNWLGYYAQSVALTSTTASKACFIGSLAVIVVPALDTLFGRKKRAEGQIVVGADLTAGTRPGDKLGHIGGIFEALNGPWFPALLAAAGVASLELIGAEGDPPNVGDAWALAQPLCFALAFWRMERHCRAYPKNAWGLVGAQMLIIAILSGLWCAVDGELPSSLDSVLSLVFPASGSLAMPITILWTGIVTTALSVYGETLALQKVSAAESTIILSTQPIWGTAFAAVVLGETVGWNTLVGAVLIISACTWTSVGPVLQARLLSMVAATGAMETLKEAAGVVDVGEFQDTVGAVGTVVKDIVQDHL